MDMKTSPHSLLNDPSLLKTDALINGQWVQGSSRFDVNNPATGLKLADVANLGPNDATAAIDAELIAVDPDHVIARARRDTHVGKPATAELVVTRRAA